MARLRDGCRRLSIPEPDTELIAAEIGRLRGDHPKGTVKVIVTRGSSRRGYGFRANLVPTRIVRFDSAATAVAGPGDGNGERIAICRTPASLNPRLAGLKTLNRLDNVLACAEWQDTDCSEGLMLDPEGRVIGGTMSNVFVARAGRLLTPSVERCGIRGVMRAVVMEAAQDIGLPVQECEVSLRNVEQAEEIFLTNALSGLRPVGNCAGRAYRVGPVTLAIAAALRDRGVNECPC